MRLAVFVAVLVAPVASWAQARLPPGEEDVNRASEKIVRSDYAGAEPLLRRAVVEAPNDPYAHYNLAAVLRATGRGEAAIPEYRRAKELFETVGPRANGQGDIANCLYGIGLAEEARGDAQAAARAWGDYIRFAQRYSGEQPAVAIARQHAQADERLARTRGPFLGPKEATRPSTTR